MAEVSGQTPHSIAPGDFRREAVRAGRNNELLERRLLDAAYALEFAEKKAAEVLRARARASTGVRPAELKRTEPADVDLDRCVWVVRTAKGGEPRAFWLNDDMVAAWKAFIAADAWGHFDGSDYAKALYVAGWPKDVRPYQARHSGSRSSLGSAARTWETCRDG